MFKRLSITMKIQSERKVLSRSYLLIMAAEIVVVTKLTAPILLLISTQAKATLKSTIYSNLNHPSISDSRRRPLQLRISLQSATLLCRSSAISLQPYLHSKLRQWIPRKSTRGHPIPSTINLDHSSKFRRQKLSHRYKICTDEPVTKEAILRSS